MDYKKYLKEKFAEIFDYKIKALEKKALEDLKELEIMKYELYDIYEGKKFNKIYFILDNQDDTIIEHLKNKKLLYTYFEEENAAIELTIEKTNNFYFEPLKKENLDSKQSNSNNANSKNAISGKSNPKK